MSTETGRQDKLLPLPYHQQILSYLREQEPEVWAWTTSQDTHPSSDDLQSQLLRDTYRLTANSHPQAYALCEQALQRLQIHAPATLYQASSESMNASLCFVPGEAHIVLHGPVLERLEDLELLALLGHELAHYKLWSADNGHYLATERILNHSASELSYLSSYAETARLYSLHTELYADRGAALASQSASATISMLVKVHSGAAEVDPAAYLQQAIELDQKTTSRSAEASHPESFLRSQAIDLWWRQDEQLDDWLQRRLHGPLQLTSLDLPGQVALTRITREFIARFTQPPALQSDEVMAQIQDYFPDWKPETNPLDLSTLNADRVDTSVLEYLQYVMLDLALVDQSAREQALVHATEVAAQLNCKDSFMQILKRDLKMNKRQLNRLEKQLKGSISA